MPLCHHGLILLVVLHFSCKIRALGFDFIARPLALCNRSYLVLLKVRIKTFRFGYVTAAR